MKTILIISGIIFIIMITSASYGQAVDSKLKVNSTEIKADADIQISNQTPANETDVDNNGYNIQIIDGRKVIMVGDEGAQSLINPDELLNNNKKDSTIESIEIKPEEK